MTNDIPKSNAQLQTDKIADDLATRYGPMIGGAELIKALGYSNGQAFRQAHRSNRLGVNVFNIPARQGKFALTTDVANWLVSVSTAA